VFYARVEIDYPYKKLIMNDATCTEEPKHKTFIASFGRRAIFGIREILVCIYFSEFGQIGKNW
jgi:hypothetical protein